MTEMKVTAHTIVTSECGHEFEVSVVRIDPETDLVCPTCGAVDHLTADQVAALQGKLDDAVRKAATDYVADQLDRTIRKAVGRSKNITYTSKRR